HDLLTTTPPLVPFLKRLETGNAPGEGKITEIITEQNRPRKPLQDIMSTMMQPDNLQNMMGMVDQMLNPNKGGGESGKQGSGSGGKQGGGGGGLGGLVGNMMSSMLSQPGGLGGLMNNIMREPEPPTRQESNKSTDAPKSRSVNRQVSNGGLFNVDMCKL
ncbi:MAG: hypothetical protein GY861_05325, partial [bacterium]|nr:hypothetical protein [bacterium]